MALLGQAGWDGLGAVRTVREIISDPALEPQSLVEELQPSPLEPSSGAASGATTVPAGLLSTSIVATARGGFYMCLR